MEPADMMTPVTNASRVALRDFHAEQIVTIAHIITSVISGAEVRDPANSGLAQNRGRKKEAPRGWLVLRSLKRLFMRKQPNVAARIRETLIISPHTADSPHVSGEGMNSPKSTAAGAVGPLSAVRRHRIRHTATISGIVAGEMIL